MKSLALFLLLTAASFAQTIDIVLATYGAGQLVDVTQTIRDRIASGRTNVRVTLDDLGVSDPVPGRVKSLRVVFRQNNGLYEMIANDFETMALPTGTLVVAGQSASPGAGSPAAGSQGAAAQPTTVQPTSGGFFDLPGSSSASAATNTAAGAAGTPAVNQATGTGATTGTTANAPAAVSVSPVASVPNGACFYTQSNYGGTPYCFASGSATATLGNQRRHFRSMRLVGSAQGVWLFDADNFTGASVRLTRSQPDLRAAQGAYYSTDFEDRAASLRVE